MTVNGKVYHYTGQPSGTLYVDRDWTKLDVEPWNPPKNQLNLAMTYVNVNRDSIVWEDGAEVGTIRIRIMRLNDDDGASAFNTFVVKRDSDDDHLITHVWFEKGVEGHALRWEMRAADGIKSFKAGTRYGKFACVDL